MSKGVGKDEGPCPCGQGTAPRLDGEPVPSVRRAFTGVAKGLTQPRHGEAVVA